MSADVLISRPPLRFPAVRITYRNTYQVLVFLELRSFSTPQVPTFDPFQIAHTRLGGQATGLIVG